MKKFIILLISLSCYNMMAQNFQWAKGFKPGFSSDISGESVTSDASGNVYSTGYFQGTVDFNPGTGIYNLTSSNSGQNNDCFISKLDGNGTFVWAKHIGGTGGLTETSITADAIGNIFIAGSFFGTIDFDPGVGTVSFSSNDTYLDFFILKLDTTGNFAWVQTFGDTTFNNKVNSIVTDTYNNVYITGDFSGTIDFDYGVGVSNLSSINYSSYILKLTNSGNFLWAKNFENCYSYDLATDATYNLYSCGIYYGTVDFNSDPVNVDTLNNYTNGQAYILKLDSLGNYLWVKSIGDSVTYTELTTISADTIGNIYTSGVYHGTYDFDPSVGTYTSSSVGVQDLFVCKYNTNGDFVWAKTAVGIPNRAMYARSSALDSQGNIYTTGMYYGTVDFYPGSASSTITAGGLEWNTFILKLGSSGNFNWVKSITSNGAATSNSNAVDLSGNVFTIGNFETLTNFDPAVSNYTMTYNGLGYESYIVKLGSNNTVGIEQSQTSLDKSIAIFPNPNNGSFNIVAKEKMNLSIIDNLGQIIQYIELNETNGYQQTIQINTSGIYYISGVSEQSSTKQKIIIAK